MNVQFPKAKGRTALVYSNLSRVALSSFAVYRKLLKVLFSLMLLLNANGGSLMNLIKSYHAKERLCLEHKI